MKIFELDQPMQESSYEEDLAYFHNKRNPSFVLQGIAIIHIHGMIKHNLTQFERDSGSTDYNDIALDLDRAASNPEVKGVLLVVNSPGGTVDFEISKKVQTFQKPIVAYIDERACSAAYKITCCADYIFANESSIVGSIGSILVVQDTEELHKSMGIRINAITNDGATLKSAGHTPAITEDQLAFLQSQIDYTGNRFKETVLENRPMVDHEVFKAGWYYGEQAFELGLIDEVGTLDQALSAVIAFSDWIMRQNTI